VEGGSESGWIGQFFEVACWIGDRASCRSFGVVMLGFDDPFLLKLTRPNPKSPIFIPFSVRVVFHISQAEEKTHEAHASPWSPVIATLTVISALCPRCLCYSRCPCSCCKLSSSSRFFFLLIFGGCTHLEFEERKWHKVV